MSRTDQNDTNYNVAIAKGRQSLLIYGKKQIICNKVLEKL